MASNDTTLLLPRRRLVLAAAATPAAGLGGGLAAILAHAQAPAAIGSDRERAGFPWGVQSGDIGADRAVVWARGDRPARLWVEWSTRASFADARRVRGPAALEEGDFTARVDLRGLPAGEEIFYRLRWEDLAGNGAAGPIAEGHLRTAPAARRDLRFLWSGDTAGQGWGIDESRGGMTIYEAMRRRNPDFFLHSGDTIYADGPMQAEVRLADGSLWRNLVTEEKSKVAETLHEFRGAYRYNLLDANMRRFNSEVAQVWQWDDHEVMNNWSPSKDIRDDARYTEKHVPLLVARAARAFHDYAPMRAFGDEEAERVYRSIPYGPLLEVFVLDMRSYRGPNGYNREPEPGGDATYLGEAQLAWLREGLRRSKAVWKVIAADMPIGLLVPDGKDAQGRPKFEAIANGNGPVLGREFEIAGLLSFIKRERIRNTVWLTADVHYTAAHHYHPERAQFKDFEPFWEFVSGPLHAGTFGPNELDDTFGPELRFIAAPAPGEANLPPSAGLQFFGEVEIDGRSAVMTVHLRDAQGRSLWQTTIEPARA